MTGRGADVDLLFTGWHHCEKCGATTGCCMNGHWHPTKRGRADRRDLCRTCPEKKR